jgi:Fe-only nitrogenase accessory protein AnfO
MAKEIAVFAGPDGMTVPLDGAGKVVVYRRAQGSWETDRLSDFDFGKVRGMRELRLIMHDMLEFLGGCRIFVARSAAGVPYFELEKAGYSVWEIEGLPAGFLEHVWEEEEREREAEIEQPAPALPVPEETTPGNYYINIREIQGGNADLTSKQILQQFIRWGGFHSLSIVCSHIPPWVEMEAMGRGFGFEAEQVGRHEFRVRVVGKAGA